MPKIREWSTPDLLNYGRPNPDGTYSDRTKYGMISVIIREVGHNFFPMIVNSDERQWGWMDEGLLLYAVRPSRSSKITIRHAVARRQKLYATCLGIKTSLAPSQPILKTLSIGAQCFGKPATALNILRETIVGKIFLILLLRPMRSAGCLSTHTGRLFPTMEDASAVDLTGFGAVGLPTMWSISAWEVSKDTIFLNPRPRSHRSVGALQHDCRRFATIGIYGF